MFFCKLNNRKLKPGECHIFQKAMQFLGHTVSAGGTQPNPEKIETVTSWPRPSSKECVQRFLGLASYYQCCIRNFLQIAEPLTNLTRKNVTFKWMMIVRKLLRDALVNYPILAYPDFSQPFTLTMDASGKGSGARNWRGLLPMQAGLYPMQRTTIPQQEESAL